MNYLTKEKIYDSERGAPANMFAIYIDSKFWKKLPAPWGMGERRAFEHFSAMCDRKTRETGVQWSVIMVNGY
jgi:hypothetical protein